MRYIGETDNCAYCLTGYVTTLSKQWIQNFFDSKLNAPKS